MFTISKPKLVLLVVEKTIELHPRAEQMVSFGVCRGNSPSWDGEVKGFDTLFVSVVLCVSYLSAPRRLGAWGHYEFIEGHREKRRSTDVCTHLLTSLGCLFYFGTITKR